MNLEYQYLHDGILYTLNAIMYSKVILSHISTTEMCSLNRAIITLGVVNARKRNIIHLPTASSFLILLLFPFSLPLSLSLAPSVYASLCICIIHIYILYYINTFM